LPPLKLVDDCHLIMDFSWFSCKTCSESDPTQHMEIETPISPVRKTDKENVQPRQSPQQNAKEAIKPELSDKLLSCVHSEKEESGSCVHSEKEESGRVKAEKEKTKQKEKEAKEAEKQKKQAQKEAKEKAEREAKEAEKQKKQAQKEAKEKAEREAKEEQKKEAQKHKKEEEARQAAARLQKLGPLGRTGATLQVELETGWADCGQDEFKQVCDHVAGGGTKFAIQAQGTMYIIDWSQPNAATQKNVQSGKTRKLRVI